MTQPSAISFEVGKVYRCVESTTTGWLNDVRVGERYVCAAAYEDGSVIVYPVASTTGHVDRVFFEPDQAAITFGVGLFRLYAVSWAL